MQGHFALVHREGDFLLLFQAPGPLGLHFGRLRLEVLADGQALEHGFTLIDLVLRDDLCGHSLDQYLPC